MKNKPLIFLSHATEDEKFADEIYKLLKKSGYKPWMHEKDMLAGKDWDIEIRKILPTSDFVIAFLSNNSVNKEGYIQDEFRLISQVLKEIPKNDIFLIPVKIDDCELPLGFSKFHFVDLIKDNYYDKIVKSIKHQIEINTDKSKSFKSDESNEEFLNTEALRENTRNFTNIEVDGTVGNYLKEDLNNSNIQNNSKYEFTYAFSFAGKDRDYVMQVYEYLRSKNIKVFYDETGLSIPGPSTPRVGEIFKTNSKFAVLFISKYYMDPSNDNCSFEREIAIKRNKDFNSKYIIPARFDDTAVYGLHLPNYMYVDLNKLSPEDFGKFLEKKIHYIDDKKKKANYAHANKTVNEEISSDINTPISEDTKQEKILFSKEIFARWLNQHRYSVLASILVIGFIIFSFSTNIFKSTKIDVTDSVNEENVILFLKANYNIFKGIETDSNNKISFAENINFINFEDSILDANSFFANPFVNSGNKKIADLDLYAPNLIDSHYESGYWITNGIDTLRANLIGQLDNGKLEINSIKYLDIIETTIKDSSEVTIVNEENIPTIEPPQIRKNPVNENSIESSFDSRIDNNEKVIDVINKDIKTEETKPKPLSEPLKDDIIIKDNLTKETKSKPFTEPLEYDKIKPSIKPLEDDKSKK